jgi:hypothetical protein
VSRIKLSALEWAIADHKAAARVLRNRTVDEAFNDLYRALVTLANRA